MPYFRLITCPTGSLILALLDPVTYAVDGLRNSIIGEGMNSFIADFGLLIIFTLILGTVGTLSFRRMKAV